MNGARQTCSAPETGLSQRITSLLHFKSDKTEVITLDHAVIRLLGLKQIYGKYCHNKMREKGKKIHNAFGKTYQMIQNCTENHCIPPYSNLKLQCGAMIQFSYTI